MPLTDIKLRTLKKPGKHFDGDGLNLEVTTAGGRYWRLKYRYGGKEKRLAFGVYPEVSLGEARKRTDDARRLLRDGLDPSAEKKAEKVAKRLHSDNTFAAIATDWVTHQAGKWGETHRRRVLASLKEDVFKKIGTKPIATITPRVARQS